MTDAPRFEVLPEMGSAGHETSVDTEARFHPSGDEYTVARATCEKCEWTAHGDEAGVLSRAATHEETQGPTGRFVWHFKDAAGDITFSGGKTFSRRRDAHYSIIDVVRGNLALCKVRIADEAQVLTVVLPIVDLDERGEVIPVG